MIKINCDICECQIEEFVGCDESDIRIFIKENMNNKEFNFVKYMDELHKMFGVRENDSIEAENVEVAVAGRMLVKRVMGKASFIKLQDRSGQIQVRVERDRLPDGV